MHNDPIFDENNNLRYGLGIVKQDIQGYYIWSRPTENGNPNQRIPLKESYRINQVVSFL
jgi:hypothetical protein